MRQFLTIAAIATLIVACGKSGDKASTTTDKSAISETAAAGPDGEKIYKQYCVTCHGLYGDMGASGAFNLTQSVLTTDERIKVITDGRTGTAMVSFKTVLKEDQIAAVAKYTETLKK